MSDMATTTSQLQAKLLALTGGKVDIMLNETTFKNSTQILREMAEAWEDMNDIQRASALELMGGKRQANVLSALIQNFDTVEEAIEASQKSAGSALEENEKYLDSIQGRLDQFNNQLQSMWSNVLNDDLVKFIVQAGTELLKFIDNLGVVKTLIIGIGTYLIQKNFKGDLFGGLFNAQTIDEARDRLKNLQVDIAKLQKEGKKPKKIERKQNQANTLKASIDKYDELSKQLTKNRIDADAAKKALDDYNESLAKKYAKKKNQGKSPTAVEAAEVERLQKAYDGANDEVIKTEVALKQAEVQAKATGTAGLNAGNKIKTGFISVGKAVWKFAKEMAMSMAYTMAFTAIFEAIGNIGEGLAPLFDKIIETPEELQEKLSELENELSSVESELSNLQSELKDTDERIEELMEQGSLTFVEQEELNKLKSVSAELKAQIGLQENLQKSKQQGVNSASIEATNAYLDTSFMSEQTRTEKQEKWGETGEAIGQTVGTVGGAVFGAKVLGSIGAIGGPLGVAIGIAAGSIIGGLIGTFVGEGLAGAAYDSEQTVGEAMDSMLETRSKLKEEQDKALAENDAEAYNEATEALRTYDSQMAKHISQIQQNYNAMDWETASPEDRKEMMEYADWLDKYAISMDTTGANGAKSNAIARIFGEEAQGNIAKARDEINKLKENLAKAKKDGKGVDEALAALEGFELNLSEKEVERLRSMGIYLYEVEDYFKEVVDAETEFIDSDLEDVAKDINKITDGLASLKSAFEEVTEKGVLTAKTVMSLKEELQISKYSGIDDVTDAWREYLDVMMSGTATTEKMTAATEALAQSIIEAALEDPNGLTPDTKFEYIAQLKVLGVENAEEYVEDLLQKNMVKDIENGFTLNKSGIKQALMRRGNSKEWINGLSDDQLREYAKEYGIIGEISDDVKQKIMERYGVEESAVDAIIQKLQEKQRLENQKTIAQNSLDDYREFVKGTKNAPGFKGLQQDLGDLDSNPTYKTALQIKKGLDDWDPYSSLFPEGTYDDQGFYHFNGETYYTLGEFDAAVNAYLEEYNAKREELRKKYIELAEKGVTQGYVVKNADGTYTLKKGIEEEFTAAYTAAENGITALETELDEELTIDIELKLDLQNQDKLVDDIQSIYDELSNAQKEYAENGYISVDTMQSLLKLEPKYLDMLVDENGNLNLTKETLHEVARARIVDLGLKQQNAIVDQALALAQQGSKQALDEWIIVNENADESMKDSISTTKQLILTTLKAREAAGELPKGYTDKFMGILENQLNAVQRVTDLALSDLDNTLSSSGNTATEEANNAFKDAMDYWENRIGAEESRFQQIQNEIDSLESKGKKASAGYYNEQIASENRKLDLLKEQKKEIEKYTGYIDENGNAIAGLYKEGSEEWFRKKPAYFGN